MSDAIFTLTYLFLDSTEPSCLDSIDANDSGEMDLSDAIFVLSFLFVDGRPFPPPGELTCGGDPSPMGWTAPDTCPAPLDVRPSGEGHHPDLGNHRWRTSRPASSVVDYGKTDEYGSVAADPTLVTAHVVQLTGLDPGTVYHYSVRSVTRRGRGRERRQYVQHGFGHQGPHHQRNRCPCDHDRLRHHRVDDG